MSDLFKKSIQAIKKQKQKQQPQQKQHQESLKIGGIDFQDLSSSQQEKLKQRGAIRTKKIHKYKEQKWQRGKTVPTHPSISTNKKTVKQSYTLLLESGDKKLSVTEIYQLLGKYKIFIQELQLKHPNGMITFGEEEAARKSMEILKGVVKDVRIKGEDKEEKEDKIDNKEKGKSDIFSRFG